jgi:hypothetical protein
MKRIEISYKEKIMLRRLSESSYNKGDRSDLSKEETRASINRLVEKGLAGTLPVADGFMTAWITEEGEQYLQDNPTLENPIDNSELMKRNLELQNEKILSEKKFRALINYWKAATAISGLVGLALGVLISTLHLIRSFGQFFGK